MNRRLRLLITASVAIATPPTRALAAGQPVTPPPAFAQCAACHSTQPGKTVFGPSLSGVAGRKAGILPGYAYSPALKASRLTWNAATLDRWIKDPKKLIPGTRMPFVGIADAKSRKAVVDYLMGL